MKVCFFSQLFPPLIHYHFHSPNLFPSSLSLSLSLSLSCTRFLSVLVLPLSSSLSLVRSFISVSLSLLLYSVNCFTSGLFHVFFFQFPLLQFLTPVLLSSSIFSSFLYVSEFWHVSFSICLSLFLTISFLSPFLVPTIALCVPVFHKFFSLCVCLYV